MSKRKDMVTDEFVKKHAWSYLIMYMENLFSIRWEMKYNGLRLPKKEREQLQKDYNDIWRYG